PPTAENCGVIQGVMIAGKEEACRHTSKDLASRRNEFESWANKAAAQHPDAFGDNRKLEPIESSSAQLSQEAIASTDQATQPAPLLTTGAAPAKSERQPDARRKMLLTVAAEDCIRAHQDAD